MKNLFENRHGIIKINNLQQISYTFSNQWLTCFFFGGGALTCIEDGGLDRNFDFLNGGARKLNGEKGIHSKIEGNLLERFTCRVN